MVKKMVSRAKQPKSTSGLKEYTLTLANIKQRIQQAQIKAALAANKELLALYWDIGRIIADKQKEYGWGSKFIEQLAQDLQNNFPGVSGFSRTNVFNMKQFYLTYAIVQQPAGQLQDSPVFNIPWWHNVILIQKLENNEERFWYAQKTIDNGWSRVMLEHWIGADLYRREGKAISNFKVTLPNIRSDLAQQSLKDPYLFDFLTLDQQYREQELEQGLIDHIQKFLLELGQGFAFVGRQVPICVDDQEFYIDLLFYHTHLHCYFVIELKVTDFDPRDTGQISFYLAAVDNQIKHAEDKPTIGLLLCKKKSKLVVEYALRTNVAPIGVASYETKLVESLPKNLKSTLPTIEEIEEGLTKQGLISKKTRTKKK